MADEDQDQDQDQDQAEHEGLRFEPANPVQSINEVSRRDKPAGTVNRSGLTPLNTAATALADGLANKAGLDVDDYCVRLGANTEAGLVSCHVVRPDAPKAMPFRRRDDDRTITLYLHGVFKDFPSLRPEGRRTCRVSPTRDADGVACLIINLRGGLAKVKGRGGGTGGDGGQGESG